MAEDKDMQGPFLPEEKLIFGVHAHAMSQLTIAKMRKIYNKIDSKSIAKQVSPLDSLPHNPTVDNPV